METLNKKEEEHILPVSRPRSAAADSYDRLSGFYDLLTAAGERPYRQAGLGKLAVQTGERVLEIGIGTGLSLLPLVEAAGAGGRVWGLDLSMGMIRRAKERVLEGGHAARVTLCRADAVHLPFAGSVFDAAWMSFTLELFDTPDIPRVLGEIRRVLEPGGRLAVAALSREGEASWMRRVYEWGHRQFPAVLDCRPIYVARALADAGFQVYELERMKYWGIPVEIVCASNPGALLCA